MDIEAVTDDHDKSEVPKSHSSKKFSAEQTAILNAFYNSGMKGVGDKYSNLPRKKLA